MESTSSYWKPLYNVEWIADFLQHGLLQPSYIPDKAQRELRKLVGYRKSLVRNRTAELNRLQKMLEGANIKLSGTVSDINGKSAGSILDVVRSGEEVTAAGLVEMREKKLVAANLRITDAQLADDLNGVVTPL